MRVGFFTNNYLPRVTGVAHTVEGFREGLAKRGHDVFIFAPKYHSDHGEENVFRFRSLRIPTDWGNEDYTIPPLPVTRSIKLKKKIKELDLDIIHSHQPYLLGKTARRFARKFSIPLIFTPHTPYHEYFDSLPVGLDEAMKNLIFYLLSDYGQWCAGITVPTQSMKKMLQDIGVETEIEVVPSGLKLENFDKAEPAGEIREKYNIPQKTFLLLTVARLSYEKNVDFMLRVLRQLPDQDIRLMIVGEGPKKRSLEKLASSLGIYDKVIFTGQIEYEKLPCYYKSGDLFVYPSKVDSQGLVIREAQLSCLPVVAVKDCRGPRDIIKDKKTGFLVSRDSKEFARTVLKIQEDEKLRDQVAARAHKEARSLSLEKVSGKLEKVYGGALGSQSLG